MTILEETLLAENAALSREMTSTRLALEAAARSLEWIAAHGIDDEDPASLRAYTTNRARVARETIGASPPGGRDGRVPAGQEAPAGRGG